MESGVERGLRQVRKAIRLIKIGGSVHRAYMVIIKISAVSHFVIARVLKRKKTCSKFIPYV
jgi:hypothetical protein